MSRSSLILPGATLGVLGGGQLGRMFCVAARTMGYRTVVLDPDPHSPAGKVADEHIRADYADQAALRRIVETCDAVTIEFENICVESLRFLERDLPVSPPPKAVEIARNRVREKNFARDSGIRVAPFHAINQEADLSSAIEEIGCPAILKRATLGYDGKGQHVVNTLAEAREAFRQMGSVQCVLERKLNLALELSVLLARNDGGEYACYPVAENQHVNGILDTSIVPARVDDSLAAQAEANTVKLGRAMDYCGVLTVEYFVTTEGELVFNEMAPRPHNSGHYTMDACVTSQFEQQVRALCGFTPGDTRLLSPIVMVNLLGDLWMPEWSCLLSEPSAKLHLYGKEAARPGRKMGHYSCLAVDVEEALRTARRIFRGLGAGKQ